MKTVKFLGVSVLHARTTRFTVSFQVARTGLLWQRLVWMPSPVTRIASISFTRSFHSKQIVPSRRHFFQSSSPFPTLFTPGDTLFDNIPARTRNDSYRASIRYFLRSIDGRLVDHLIYNLIVFVADTFVSYSGSWGLLVEAFRYWGKVESSTDDDKLKSKKRSKLLSIDDEASDNGWLSRIEHP